MKSANPDFPNFTSEAVRKEILELGVLCHKAVKKELTGKFFSLTTDHWTSVNDESYVVLTAHWANEGEQELDSAILHLAVHRGPSSGQEMAQEFLKVFESYGFEISKVVALVSDTAANMNVFGKSLESKGIPHLYCIAHVLQLTAKLAFDDRNLPGAEGAMRAARALCEVFAKSTQAMEKLKISRELHFIPRILPADP
jgi:hypothetical protein